jgi:vitamin B12 transporter
MNRLLYSLVFPPLVAAVAPASAQVDAPGAIVVTGASLPRADGEVAYDDATIDRDRLTATASDRIEDILGDVAGFAQYRRSDSRSAQPTSQGATLRGLGGNAASRALVTLDGVPFTDPFGGWVTYSAIDPQRLGLVRVTRGGGSGAAGPGALAGTIDLQSAGPAQLSPLWADLAYGSRNSLDTHAGVSTTAGGGFAFLTASYARGDGFVPIIDADRGPVDEAAPYEQASVAARAVIPVGDRTELQASALGFYDHRTRGLPGSPNSTKGADASLRLVGRGDWGYEALAYVQFRDFAAGFSSANAARTAATVTLDQYTVPSTGLGGKIEIRPPVGDRLQIRVGADARAVSGESDELYTYVAGAPTRQRAAGGDTLTVGAFGEATAKPVDGLTLTASGRIDRWQITDGFLRQQTLVTESVLTNMRDADRSGWRPTGRGGVAWKPGDGAVTVRAAAYLGWRLPTLNELYRLYRVGSDAIAANPDLSPERLRGIDGGVDYDPLPNLHIAATLFANRLDDAIANVTLGIGPGSFPQVGVVTGRYQMRENLRAITSNGAELDARLALGRWALSASYAYTDAHVRADGAAIGLDGLRPAQTAKNSASATLAWQRSGGVYLSTTLRYLGPQFEDDQNTETLSHAVTLDADALIPIARGFALELRGENVTNTQVDTAITSPDIIERASPRTLWIGLRYGEARKGA